MEILEISKTPLNQGVKNGVFSGGLKMGSGAAQNHVSTSPTPPKWLFWTPAQNGVFGGGLEN